MPYNSMQNPISGHRKRMRTSPAKKAAVPLAFCLRAKKRRVLEGPIIMVRPMRKRIYRRRRRPGQYRQGEEVRGGQSRVHFP